MESVRVLAHMTDVEAAHRGHAQVVDQARILEQQLDTVFEKLHNARQALIDRAGVSAIVSFSEPMTCAFERWHGIHEARARAKAPGWPEETQEQQENDALRIANAAA